MRRTHPHADRNWHQQQPAQTLPVRAHLTGAAVYQQKTDESKYEIKSSWIVAIDITIAIISTTHLAAAAASRARLALISTLGTRHTGAA